MKALALEECCLKAHWIWLSNTWYVTFYILASLRILMEKKKKKAKNKLIDYKCVPQNSTMRLDGN